MAAVSGQMFHHASDKMLQASKAEIAEGLAPLLSEAPTRCPSKAGLNDEEEPIEAAAAPASKLEAASPKLEAEAALLGSEGPAGKRPATVAPKKAVVIKRLPSAASLRRQLSAVRRPDRCPLEEGIRERPLDEQQERQNAAERSTPGPAGDSSRSLAGAISRELRRDSRGAAASA